MANYLHYRYNIFVATAESADAFAEMLNHIMEISLRPAEDEFTAYDYEDGEKWLTLGTHMQQDDPYFHFEDYRFQITIGSLALDTESNAQRARDYAHDMFERLKASGKYGLLLFEGLDNVVNQFDPGQQT